MRSVRTYWVDGSNFLVSAAQDFDAWPHVNGLIRREVTEVIGNVKSLNTSRWYNNFR